MTDTRVGVVGDAVEPIASAIDSAGGKPLLTEHPRQLDATPAFIVAVGGPALRALVPEASAPILPVETDTPGLDPITRDRAHAVLSRLVDLFSTDRSEDNTIDPQQFIVTHPVIGVEGERQANRGHALVDVALLTAEPARISEYTVIAGTDSEIMSVRADGVVVATPAGSHGYAHAAGGPRLGTETGVGAVVPIAPFSTDADHWVVSLSELQLTVDRDETSVELLLDGRRAGPVSPTETLWLRPVDTIETITVQQGLEKL